MPHETVAATLAMLKDRLRKAGIASAQLDARLIVQHACRLSHEQLIADPLRVLTETERQSVERLARRRAAHEPVSRLLGEREFYGRMFQIDRSTLDPRPDTETLVETALSISRMQNSSESGWRVADIGTGSGAIIVTLLAELPKARGVASDISREALAVARENALRHNVASRLELVHGSWFEGFEGSFDLVVSNPPYIEEAALGGLPPEVRLHDPPVALNGGPDGLNSYRQIAREARRFLRIGGCLCLEIGWRQEEKVKDLMIGGGLRPTLKAPPLTPDLCGINRVMAFENA